MMSRDNFYFSVRVLFLVFLAMQISGCEGQVDPITLDSGVELAEDGNDGLDHVTDVESDDIVLLPDVPDASQETVTDLDASKLDVGPDFGESGAPCNAAEDCNSGFCIQTADGRQCTQTCIDECPFDWKCVHHTPSTPDQIFICVPVQLSLCRPCQTSTDCQVGGIDTDASCVAYGESGSFCGSSCDGEDDCPQDYQCQQGTDVGGQAVTLCMLVEGECECNPLFVDQGAETQCFVQNGSGTCYGQRKCVAAGLTQCSAVVPAPEQCNGADDDCNGTVDENTGGADCLVTGQFGTCPGVFECSNSNLVCIGEEAHKETCDGEDNDCDGQTDEGFPDTDEDNIADCLETDIDGDGIVDGKDNCPYDFNPGQEDFDLDNDGDPCDADDDNDMSADADDCAPKDSTVKPGADETCDGKDNNCNYIVDEGFDDTDADGWKDCIDSDDDNDGTPDAFDCGPTDKTIFPGAAEICDGLDNDCDSDVDEGFDDMDDDGVPDCLDGDTDGDGFDDTDDNCPGLANPDQADLDADGIGDACDLDLDGDGVSNTLDNCPLGFNPTQTDTDLDTLGNSCDPDIDGDDILNAADNCQFTPNPEQLDGDNDGTGDACDEDADGDTVPDAQDCAPHDPQVYPGAEELCDGIDNNCDLAKDEGYPDFDADGLKNCIDQDDDDDGEADQDDCAPLNPAVNSMATEVCDGTDNDCNLEVDDGLGQVSCGKGECFHTVPVCEDGNPTVCDPLLGAELESCDGLDNDCDGLVDEDLGTVTCGMGQCLHTVANCIQGIVQDCNPTDGTQPEICDGQDNDCDGKTDEDLGQLACGKGQCYHTISACSGGITLVCDPFQGALPEVCDGADNDCDGETDEDLGTTTCGLGICEHTTDNCSNNAPSICNPFLGAQAETCDGQDNNCNGIVDDGLGTSSCGLGQCQHVVDNCQQGNPVTCNPLENSIPEICDGLDNDCDGVADENLGTITCGFGICQHIVTNCVDGQTQECDPMQGSVDEVCDGLDNNCDDDIDEGFDDSDVDGLPDCIDPDDDNDGDLDGDDCMPFDPLVGPSQTEICYNQTDDDCSDDTPDKCYMTSCNEILSNDPAAASGLYNIEPTGQSEDEAFEVYCDMTDDAGGWTLVAVNGDNHGLVMLADAMGELSSIRRVNPGSNAIHKLSDEAINLIKEDAGDAAGIRLIYEANPTIRKFGKASCTWESDSRDPADEDCDYATGSYTAVPSWSGPYSKYWFSGGLPSWTAGGCPAWQRMGIYSSHYSNKPESYYHIGSCGMNSWGTLWVK
jgi:hypothetical protein